MTRPVAWFDISGKHADQLRRFYTELFEWEIEPVANRDYAVVAAVPPGIPGGIGQSQPGHPARVAVFVEVDDVAAALAKAVALGGKAVMPLTEIGEHNLVYAQFADPEGNVIGLSNGVIGR